MSKLGRKYTYSSLYCSVCNLRMTIPRPTHHKRAEGHIKTMYCAKCGKITDFIEQNYISREKYEYNSMEPNN